MIAHLFCNAPSFDLLRDQSSSLRFLNAAIAASAAAIAPASIAAFAVSPVFALF